MKGSTVAKIPSCLGVIFQTLLPPPPLAKKGTKEKITNPTHSGVVLLLTCDKLNSASSSLPPLGEWWRREAARVPSSFLPPSPPPPFWRLTSLEFLQQGYGEHGVSIVRQLLRDGGIVEQKGKRCRPRPLLLSEYRKVSPRDPRFFRCRKDFPAFQAQCSRIQYISSSTLTHVTHSTVQFRYSMRPKFFF